MNAAAVLPLTPSRDAARTHLPVAPRLRTGLEAWLHGLAGRRRRRARRLRDWTAAAERIAARAALLRDWTDLQLEAELVELRTAFRRGAARQPPPVEAALAAVSEMARRTLGLEAHRVQLAGAYGLGEGALVEMATGEGKTLVLGLAAAVAAWSGRPCHVVTANDYLAARDARTLATYYRRCGVTVGHVIGGQPPEARRAGHAADVTYTTAKELVADFLRDRLQLGRWQPAARRAVRALVEPRAAGFPGLVLRGLHTVLVDEADHALIDEAVTPLIISRPRRDALLTEACREATEFAAALQSGVDYRVDVTAHVIDLTPDLTRRIRENWQPRARVLRNRRWRVELVRQALQAREFFVRDKQYVLRGDKVVIVDEGTGRPQDQRSWRQGLHQMIEAKEGLPLTDPAETLASVSFQRFFRQVPRLAGVTGTAAENAAELWRGYGLPVLAVPTHRPCVRRMHPLDLHASAEERWRAAVATIARVHATGQPVLVGTRSVAASEFLAGRLAEQGIACAVLNARQLEREAEIVALAGQRGRVTIATNLAGRGTDILLGSGVPELGGLCVVATEMHSAGRIDRQLHGRSARQGDPGEVYRFASLEDELAVRWLPPPVRAVVAAGLQRGWAAARRLAPVLLRWAQRRSETAAARQRAALLQRDTWLQSHLGV